MATEFNTGGDNDLNEAVKSRLEANPNTNTLTDGNLAKLTAIQAEATKNETDAALRDRSTHTGTQPASSIAGLLPNVQAVIDDTNEYTDGTILGTREEGFAYRVDSTATDANTYITNSATTPQKLVVLPGQDGRYPMAAWNLLGWPNDDNDKIKAAVATGYPLTLGAGRYKITERIALGNRVDVLGNGEAIIEHDTPDLAHFLASGLDYFAFRGVTLKGTLASTGSTDADQRAAIVVQNTGDFDVEFCHFDQLVGSGVTISRGGTYVNAGRVRFNRFTKGSGFASDDPWGTQDCAPVQMFQYAKNITVEGNTASGKWYCAFLAQDQINDGASRIYGLRVVDNDFRDLSQYGITLYTLRTMLIDGISQSTAGGFRITTTAGHNLKNGDKVHLRECLDADGIWEITVVNATIFDLVGSTHSANTAIGKLRMSENCSGVFSNNVIDGVDGDKETIAPGSKSFGAGFYVQSAGGIYAADNVFRRTNLFTNSETLTPGGIGINAATGPVTFTGGGSFDSGYHGVSIKSAGFYGRIRVGGGGMIISRAAEISIQIVSPDYVTVADIEVETKPDSASGRVLVQNTDGRGSGLKLESIICRNYNATASPNFLQIEDVDNLSMRGVECYNAKPASEPFDCARLIGCANSTVSDCVFDAGQSAYTALAIDGTTDSHFRGNRLRSQIDAAARPIVDMRNTCTGTVFHRDNDVLQSDGTGARPSNTSTGGKMHTRSSNNNSGGKTRQIGDTIENSDYADTESLFWVKTAVSTGSANWKSVVPA